MARYTSGIPACHLLVHAMLILQRGPHPGVLTLFLAPQLARLLPTPLALLPYGPCMVCYASLFWDQWVLPFSCSVAKLCPTLCNPMDCSQQGSSVHGIFQARILKRIAISFSRGSFQLRNWTRVSCIGRWILYHWAIWKALSKCNAAATAAKSL